MVQLRPIRNEEEHETALAEIYSLWNAERGTAEAAGNAGESVQGRGLRRVSPSSTMR